MGKYAVVKNNMVQNVIVLDAKNVESMSQALNAEIVDAMSYGLVRGDLRVGNNWTRNLNGIQTILEELRPEQQTDYSNLVDQVAHAEELETQLVETEALLDEYVLAELQGE